MPEGEKSGPQGERARRNLAEAKLWCSPFHFYSPLPNTQQLEQPRYRLRTWPPEPYSMPGVDWRPDAQVELCRDVFARQEPLEFAAEATEDPTEYTRSSPNYPLLDACVLQAFLRDLGPARVIEVGAGYSSLVIARVNRELLGGRIRFTAIDPFPKPFIQAGVPGMSDLRVEEIQDTPLELFEQLGAGDVLLIDTSHAVKTGGDVPWIYNQILPRLAPGVVVHVHDIFLPGEYPEGWVFQGRAWNELYLVQSFLAYNSAFEVLFGTYWMAKQHLETLLEAFPQLTEADAGHGSSLWIRRI
jgi:predicted O-methyltransferase YrrM